MLLNWLPKLLFTTPTLIYEYLKKLAALYLYKWMECSTKLQSRTKLPPQCPLKMSHELGVSIRCGGFGDPMQPDDFPKDQVPTLCHSFPLVQYIG